MKKKIIYISILVFLIILTAGFSLMNFVSATGNDSYTKLLLHNDGADASISHSVTANGNAQIDTAQSKFGGASGLFDGTGDYLSAPDSEDWNFGSGDWTVDAWVYLNSYPANPNTIYSQLTDADNYIGLWASSSITGRAEILLKSTGQTTIDLTASVATGLSAWHHLAFVKNSNTYSIYLDGVSVGSITQAFTHANFTGTAIIGEMGTYTYYMNGQIDELRVSKGIARWTANFTPPTAAYNSDTNTNLLLHMDGTDTATVFNDISGGDVSASNNKIVYVGNAQIDTAQSKFGGASGLFDGTGDYLSLADSEDWNFGAGDFTIDTWVRFNVLTAGYRHTIVGQWGTPKGWWLFYDASPTATLYFGYSTNGTDQSFQTVSWVASINNWYHVSVVRNGNNLLFFVDGVQVETTKDVSGVTIYNSSETLNVGAHSSGGSNYLNGYLDEFRVSKGIARWTSNFTLPGCDYDSECGGAPRPADDMIVFE